MLQWSVCFVYFETMHSVSEDVLHALRAVAKLVDLVLIYDLILPYRWDTVTRLNWPLTSFPFRPAFR